MGTLEESIRKKALDLGFEAAGFCAAQASEADKQSLAAYLGRGLHGDMDWMAATAGRRADPRALWAEARSIVVVGANYGPRGDPLEALERRDRGAVSVYARGATTT